MLRSSTRPTLFLLIAALLGAGHVAAQPVPDPDPAVTAPVLVAPKAISDTLVVYPAGARGGATVVLTLVVDRAGKVASAVPNQVDEPFSSQAVESALAWVFEPATRNGVAIVAKIRVEVVFREPERKPEPEPEPATAPDPKPTKPKAEKIEIVVLGEHPEPSRTASLSRAEVRQIPGTVFSPAGCAAACSERCKRAWASSWTWATPPPSLRPYSRTRSST
jgi:hypothetical protein